MQSYLCDTELSNILHLDSNTILKIFLKTFYNFRIMVISNYRFHCYLYVTINQLSTKPSKINSVVTNIKYRNEYPYSTSGNA